ncbi:MAG: helix-turn-helix domain-containing protein [Chloroflexi bacterium]|nr:MAG: helix-turn-helix domain-containing protein [Chloroflexota bacterium]
MIPDGADAVAFANHVEWTNVPPARPTAEGLWMLTYTIRGRAAFRYPPRTEIFATAGDLVLLRRDTPGTRGVLPGDRWDALSLRFDPWPEWTPAGFERVADGLYRKHIELAGHRLALQEVWARIIAGVQERETARALASVAGTDRPMLRREERIHVELLALWIRELFLIARRESLRAPRIDPRVLGALQGAIADPSAPHKVADLARRAGMSGAHFAHVFRAQLGVAPAHLMRSMRLRQVALLLESTDDPVGVIAERTGFGSIFELSRQFRRQFGTSPRAYRAKHR